VLGEVLQVVRHVFADGGGQVQVVDLVHQHQVTPGFDQDLAHSVGDVGGILASLDRIHA
jgi:hypothetical protein